MIKLSDIRGHNAITLLEKYKGINPYIKKLKNEYLRNNKIKLTDNQSKYITENYDKEPLLLNRILQITPFLGEELKIKEELKFVPERIFVEYILADAEKTFHVYGKLKRNQEHSKMYWIPKTQLIDDPYFEKIDIEVNFEKYDKILAKYNKKMFEHQKEGVKFLLTRNGAILGDQMGVAKTMQAIVATLEGDFKKILVICPSSVKINWEREINVFCPDTTIIEGREWKSSRFTIINFDILKNFHTVGDGKKKNPDDPIIQLNREIVNSGFDLIIVDEAHMIKDKDSQRGQIISDLCIKYKIPKVWLLTGSPLANRPMDMFNLLSIIKAPLANNWHFFAKRYCEGKRFFKTLKNGKKKQIWLTNGASNLDELAKKTKNVMLRRLKSEVLDMPEKTITPLFHDLSKRGRDEYEQLWDNYIIKRKKEGKRGNIDRDLVELILLRKFMAMETIPLTIEQTENALEQDQKVIIFTNFTDELLELGEYFGNKCVLHYGQMSNTEKQNSVDEFQTNPNIKIFIGNIHSAGVGITLTAASVVIFNSLDWVPAWVLQAIDRAHRLGQKNIVSVFFNIFRKTIDERIWNNLFLKTNIINTVLGKTEENIFIDEKDIEYQNIMNEVLNIETNG